MQTTTIDIETIHPHWKAPEDDPGKFAPLPEHVPAVISWLVDDPAKKLFELHSYVRDDDGRGEPKALADLGQAIRGSQRIVTWNGRGFDMPLLSLRAMAAGVDWSFWRGMIHRYSNFKQALIHHDLMDLLGDQGGVRAIPMDGVARLLGLPGKRDITGADVERVWSEKGGPERVRLYCQEDVISTYLIYLRWCQTLEGVAAAAKVWNQVLAWAAEAVGEPWKALLSPSGAKVETTREREREPGEEG